MKSKTQKRKITVQMWRPLIEKLNKDCTEACLNRDAYLDRVLAHEAKMLVSEAGKRRNSDDAASFVKRCFAELKDHRLVSFNLATDTVDQIQAACDGVNVWRDVFMNRVIYLLAVKSSVLEHAWDFEIEDWRHEIFDEGYDIQALLLGPRLTAIRQFINDDPFLGLRVALREAYPDTEGHLHMQPLGRPSGETPKQRGLVGFSTYLEDSMVPGTAENKESQKWADELLATLGA
jgi:hypothetical protein